MLLQLPDVLLKYTIDFLNEYNLRRLDSAITNKELRKPWLKFLKTFNYCVYRYEKTQILFDNLNICSASLSQYNTLYIGKDTMVIILNFVITNNQFKTKIIKYNMKTNSLLENKDIYNYTYQFNSKYCRFVNMDY